MDRGVRRAHAPARFSAGALIGSRSHRGWELSSLARSARLDIELVFE
jgi:hypothetical protein